MQTDTLVPDRDALAWLLSQLGIPWSRFAAHRPDYLIISPPKTGSTWLADNLRRHTEVFVPSIKEVKYFSSFFKALDLGWYLDQLAPGAGRVKGEASPSYALLSVERIRLIRRLVPDLKIVFLMRDPIGRAWSHARHCHLYREANFTSCERPFEAIGDREWMANFSHDWCLASGDYLGQLRRWLSVFPREQLHIGFYEDLARDPETLLRDVFALLGVRRDVDLSGFPVRERILVGPPGELTPSLRRGLHRLLHRRTVELAGFLREHLGLTPPPGWQEVLTPPDCADEPLPEPAAPFARDFDDRYLSGVLELEEAFPTAWSPVLGAYRGYNLVWHRGQLWAVSVHVGNHQPRDISEADFRRYASEGRCFVAPTLAAVKDQVDQHIFERSEEQLRHVPTLRAGLDNAQWRLESLEADFREVANELRKVQAELYWLWPWFALVHRVLRPAWHRLRVLLGVRRSEAPQTPVPAARQIA
jgi:hypothetical protein